MKYTAKALSPKKYQLTFDEAILGTLTYKNVFKTDVTVELNQSLRYKIRSKNLWRPKFFVSSGSQKIIDIQSTWRGISTFYVNLNGFKEEYIFKKKSLFSNQYILLNSKNNILVSIDYKIIWKKLNYEYEIQTYNSFFNLPYKELLLLTLLFYTNYTITLTIASVS